MAVCINARWKTTGAVEGEILTNLVNKRARVQSHNTGLGGIRQDLGWGNSKERKGKKGTEAVPDRYVQARAEPETG